MHSNLSFVESSQLHRGRRVIKRLVQRRPEWRVKPFLVDLGVTYRILVFFEFLVESAHIWREKDPRKRDYTKTMT